MIFSLLLQNQITNAMKVIHARFGEGAVISQDSNNVTVDFNGTVKILVIAFCKLTTQDGTTFGVQYVAPAKKKLSQAKNSEKLSVTDSRHAAWWNSDGTRDENKYNAFLESREKAKWSTKSW